MKKNNVFLLFKNAVKQTFRNKIQLFGLAVLVLLSSTIFSLMQSSINRISNEYYNLISAQESNIHDFIFDPYDTVKLINAPTPPPKPENPPDPDATIEDQQLYLNQIANSITNSFIWDRVEGRTVQLNNNNDPKILKLVTYNQYARIDKLVISEGYNIGQNPNNPTPRKKQVVINKEFAQKNDIKIGDAIRVQGDRLGDSLKVNKDINNPIYSSFNWLQVVGFGTSADFITPIIDQTTPLPNKTKEGIIYVDPQQFGLTPLTNYLNNTLWYYNKAKELISIASNKDDEIYYVGKWNSQAKNLDAVVQYFHARYVNINNRNAKLVYALGDSNYRFNDRTSTLPNTIDAFMTLLIALLLIVLIITGMTVILITYKNIDQTKPQIGILKSLGYSNWKILITSLAYPMIASLVGTLFVFLPASGLQVLVVQTFANYFNLNFGSYVFNGLSYLYCLILIFGFSSFFTWIISALTVIKSPIDLINNISVARDSAFTKFVKKVSENRSFPTRFRLALFTSSIGKMAAVALTMFLGTVLMTTAIIGPKIMSDNEKVTYTGMNYKTLVEYVPPTYNSPYTFYKTYNPIAKPWNYKKTVYDENNYYTHPDRSDSQYANNLLTDNINSEAYAPIAPDFNQSSSLSNLSLFGLPYLQGKMLTKSFLAGLDQSNGDPFLIPMIVAFAWPEAMPTYNIANNDSTAAQLYTDKNYQSLRIFYSAYRSTINMNLNPKVKDDKGQLDKGKLAAFAQSTAAWGADKTGFANELNAFKFDTSDKNYPWHIEDEQDFLNAVTPPNQDFRNQWIRKSMIWFYSIFYNRLGQAVAQGTYTKAPYFIKQNIAKAFENKNLQFNISFNVVPFMNNDVDELGTYFTGIPSLQFNGKQYPIQVYGLQSKEQLGRPSFMQLEDENGYSLNPLLERQNDDKSTNIVINQTVAKQLGLKTNDTFTMATNGNIMKVRNGSNYDAIDLNKIKFDNIDKISGSSMNATTKNNANLANQYVSYDQIPSTSAGAYDNIGMNPTPMLDEVSKGNVVIDRDNVPWHKFKVVGIYNGYGQPSAYISKTNADQLLHYTDYKDQNGNEQPGAIESLYQIYQKEWEGKGTVTTQAGPVNFDRLKDLNFQQFQALDQKDALRIIFKNEFPIFNFKFSNDTNLWDISQSFSVSQDYGDFSPFGLNGGTSSGTLYQGYGQGTVANLLPLYAHKQLLNQITQLVNTILLFFIIFSLVISFFIILLTSNLVIYENKKVIATLKTLGYSDARITNVVIGMYLPVIAAMFIIGVPVGFFIVRYIINYLAFHTTWVLPFLYAWWIPVVVGAIVLAIYAITYLIEWYALKKMKILETINETN